VARSIRCGDVGRTFLIRLRYAPVEVEWNGVGVDHNEAIAAHIGETKWLVAVIV
jgi:hypothetical protein